MINGKFGVGIIGCGGISVSHFLTYHQFDNDCEIVAVSDVNEAAARQRLEDYGAADYYADWHDLLTDGRIDIVSICTPHGLHAPMTIAAAAAGKHVLCEKPMALNVGQAHEMIEACRRHNVKLSIGSERFNPRLHFIRDRVLPEIGDIEFSHLVSFFYRASTYYATAAWRGTWAMEGGGVCANQASHVWDQWQWLLGGVDVAYGYWANLLHPQIEVEDIAYGLVRFCNGSIGKFLATSCCPWQEGVGGLLIRGRHGSIHAHDAWCYEIDFTLDEAVLNEKLHADFVTAINPSYHGKFQPWQVADLFAAIRDDREPLVPEAMETLKILNGVHWNGWNFNRQFADWACSFGLPATIEAAGEGAWTGGKLMEELNAIVRDPAPHLAAPFLKGY